MLRWIIMLTTMLTVLFHPAYAGATAFGERVSDLAEVKNIRVGVTAERARIVVDATKEVDYRTMVLSNPGRVVIDLSGAWLGADVVRSQIINSPHAGKVRVAQFDKTTVRIVVETEARQGGFDVFSVEGGSSPYRVVMDFGKLGGKSSAKDTSGGKKDTPEDVSGRDGAEDGKDKETSSEQSKEEMKKESSKDKDDDAEEEEIPEPVFTPGIKGKKICIDPGHGGEDPGAIGPTGVTEKSITLRIGKEVQRLLEEAGAKVIMTRMTDTEVSPKHKLATDIDELQARCDVASKAKADVFISIHMDSFSSKSANGTTGYYYVKGSAASRRLAASIQQNLVNRIATASRGVKTCNFYVVKHTKMPATLIEVAFISNPREEKLLNSENGVKKAAVGIVQGISDFFNK